MSAAALAIVLLAAVLHAGWNAIVKGAGDRALTVGAVAAAHVIVGLAALPFVPVPAAEAWPYIVASTVIHIFYYGFLFLSYRFGDLSHVYPIARGVAPLLVALGALAFAGETLSPAGWSGVGAVSAGIAILALRRNGIATADRSAVLAALATGTMIAGYSVVDGIGIRLAGAPSGYIAWLFAFELPVAAGVLVLRGRRGALPRRALAIGLAGGLLSTAAYALALYAKTIAPLAAVSAVRESSVIIAALIGIVLFRERPVGRRLVAAAVVAAGVILLATAG